MDIGEGTSAVVPGQWKTCVWPSAQVPGNSRSGHHHKYYQLIISCLIKRKKFRKFALIGKFTENCRNEDSNYIEYGRCKIYG